MQPPFEQSVETTGHVPLVLLNGTDPANLYGPQLADAPLRFDGRPLTFTRIPSTWLVQQRGQPILLLERHGAQITTVAGVDEGTVRQALHCWLDHMATFQRRIVVERWNDDGVLGSVGQPLLESLGFYREYPQMIWSR